MSFKPVIPLLISCFVGFPVVSETLPEIVQQAHQRLRQVHSVNPDSVASNAAAVNRWLQGPVSLQLNALPSRSDVGTDEYEVGVTLPFRSPLGHRLDEQQTALLASLTQARERRFSLLVSGVVREALWRRLVAQETLNGLQSKMQWIDEFDQTLYRQYELGEVDRTTFLRWKQEKLSHRLAMHHASIAVKQATHYYQDVTGTQVLPEMPQETVVQSPKGKLVTHPELRLLSLSQSHLALALKQTDTQLTPWTLSIIGRHLNGPTGNENLVGIAVNIPLPTGNSTSVSDHANWRDASHALADATADTYAVLLEQLRDAQQSYASRKEAAAVLTEQVAIGEEIIGLFEQRQGSLPKLTWLEQLIKQQDLRVELQTNRMLVHEAVAKINQVAGVRL